MREKIMLRTSTGVLCCTSRQILRRWMVGKAANRAAVHGSKLPLPDIIPNDELKMEINGAIEEKERKRREIESCVDSHLKNWQVLYVDEIVTS